MNIEKNEKNEEIKRKRSSSLTNIKVSKGEVGQVNSENLFAYDVKYTKMFEKKKEESDADFFLTFENLRENENLKCSNKLNTANVDENLSIKDESSINKDILNLINSPQQQTITKKKHSSQSIISIDSNGKTFEIDLQKREDFEIKLHCLVDKDTRSPIIQKRKQTIFENINDEDMINHSFDGKIHLQNKKNYIPRESISPIQIRNFEMKKEIDEKDIAMQTFQKTTVFNQNLPFMNNYQNNIYEIQNANSLPQNKTILNVTNIFQFNNLNIPTHFPNYVSPIKSIYDNYNLGNEENYQPYVQENLMNYKNIEQFENFNRILKPIKQVFHLPLDNLDDLTEEEIEQYAYQLSKEQMGCRFLQKRLDEYQNFGIKLYHKLKDYLIELMNDSFGNYLIQKLLEKINCEILEEIIYKIAPHFLSLGLDSHGTRVLQKIFDVIYHNTSLLNLYLGIFSPYIVISFVKDINGNHIIQKLVYNLGFPNNQFIIEIVKTNLLEIGTHKHGCCVLQKCIEVANPTQKTEIIKLIVLYTQQLIIDQYGNYVVQYIITMNNYSINRQIVEQFLKLDFVYISKQKYSSNVIEKCFDYSDKEIILLIVKQVAQKDVIKSLLFDSYGNYVLQKALAVAEEPYFQLIINNIATKLDKLRTHHSFGNKLYNKLIANYPELTYPVTNKTRKSIPGMKNSQNNNLKKNNQNSYVKKLYNIYLKDYCNCFI